MVAWIINKWLARQLTKLLKTRDLTKIKAWATKLNAATSKALEAVADNEITADEVNGVVEAFTNA